MNWIYAKLAGMGTKVLALLGALGGIALMWLNRSYHKKRADNAERNTTAMKAQIDQRLNAEDAARVAGVEGQDKLNEVNDKIKRNDYSSLDD